MAEVMELWMESVWKQPLVPVLPWEYGATPTNTGTAEQNWAYSNPWERQHFS